MERYVDMRSYDRKTIIYNYNRSLPQPKRHRGSGGYYLSAIGSAGSRFGHIFDGLSSFGVLKMFFLLLLFANLFRLLVNDPYLSFSSMLNQMSQIKTIPTEWIGKMTSTLNIYKDVDNIAIKNVLQILQNLILPLPTILYLIVGLLNIVWWLTSLLSIFAGSFMGF